MVDMRWKQNTCPICERSFKVTPGDDVLLPSCGCFPATEGAYPCEECGLAHIYAHDGEEPPPGRMTAIVGDGIVIATAIGKDAGRALTEEFFVEP